MGYSDMEHNTDHSNITDVIRLKGNAWNGQNKRISAITDPITSGDVMTLNCATLSYLNKLTGGSMGCPININGHELFNIRTNNTQDTSAINTKALKKYVNTTLASCILWEIVENSHYGISV